MVVDHFSDELLKDAYVGKDSALNKYLRRWGETQSATRLAGLKFQRTLWLSAQAGGPHEYIPSEQARVGVCPMSLEGAHFDLHITDDEFNRVAEILAKSLDHFEIGGRHKDAILQVFAAHQREVTLGQAYSASVKLEDIPVARRKSMCPKMNAETD
jgi:truncated hemoglobin YjbI